MCVSSAVFDSDDEFRELEIAECDCFHQWHNRSCISVSDYVFRQKKNGYARNGYIVNVIPVNKFLKDQWQGIKSVLWAIHTKD